MPKRPTTGNQGAGQSNEDENEDEHRTGQPTGGKGRFFEQERAGTNRCPFCDHQPHGATCAEPGCKCREATL